MKHFATKQSSLPPQERTFEQRWNEIVERRQKNISYLIDIGVLDFVGSSSLRRSNSKMIVGTTAESTEMQRGGRLFSSPTSRETLLGSFKP